jgi:cation diffusion facilitator family transporter
MATRHELAEVAHDHDYLGPAHERNARRTLWVVALTAAMMVGEIVAGTLTGSMALLADGFHMATHAGALGIAALAYRFARRHVANPRFSFGTGKVGDLAGFASAVVLGLISLGIAVESLIRLARPLHVDFSAAIAVATLGLVVNVASALLLGGSEHLHTHRHDTHHHHGHAHAHNHGSDNNLRAAYLHVLADALTSVLAIIALCAGRFLGWVWLDPVMGLVGAIVIARWSWSLIRDTSNVLLDVADPDLVDEVRSAVDAGGCRAELGDLHVWRIGPETHAAIVSITGDVDAEEVRQRLLSVHELGHVTVEVRRRCDKSD